MFSNRIKISISITLAVLIIFCGTLFIINKSKPITVNSDYTAYDSENNLINDADVIVIGDVTNVSTKKIKVFFTEGKEYKNNEDKKMYTVSTIKISKVIKGKLNEGDTIEVKQLGDGQKFTDEAITNNGGYFKNGDKKVFFLKDFSNFGVPYSALNPVQGTYSIVNGIVKINENNKLFKKGSKGILSSQVNTIGEIQTPEQFTDIVTKIMNNN